MSASLHPADTLNQLLADLGIHPDSIRSGFALKILTDNDIRLLSFLRKGAHGATSVLAGLFPRPIVDLARLRSEVTADELERTIRQLAELIFAAPMRNFRARVKYLFYYSGVISNPEVRRPLLSISSEECALLSQAYEDTRRKIDHFYANARTGR